jgi:hypothetical protein
MLPAEVAMVTGKGLEKPVGAPICPTLSPLGAKICKMAEFPLISPVTDAVVKQG